DEMLAASIDGDDIGGDAGDQIYRNHHVVRAQPQEPTRFDAEEAYLVLVVVHHQTIDRAYVLPRAIQHFPAPDILVGCRHRLIRVTQFPEFRGRHESPPRPVHTEASLPAAPCRFSHRLSPCPPMRSPRVPAGRPRLGKSLAPFAPGWIRHPSTPTAPM